MRVAAVVIRPCRELTADDWCVQIVAVYEEQDGRRQQHNGGDGTSASSVGTSSPDIFQSVPNCTSKTTDSSNYSSFSSQRCLQ